MTDRNPENAQAQETRIMAHRAAELLLGIPDRTAALEERLGTISDQICRQSRTLQKLAELADEQNRLVHASVQSHECLERASRQQAELGAVHYQQHVLDPLARQVFPLIDDLHQFLEQGPSDPQVQALLSALQAQLLDLLATHGIEMFAALPGEAFDPLSMRPVKRVRVFDPKEGRTVGRVLKFGFRRAEAVLRHQSIEVCMYRAPAPALAALACSEEEA